MLQYQILLEAYFQDHGILSFFLPSSFLFTYFNFSAFFTAQLKKVWSPALACCVINSSNVKEDVLGPAAVESVYRPPHEPQNNEPAIIFLAPQTEQNILVKRIYINKGLENIFVGALFPWTNSIFIESFHSTIVFGI